MARSLKDILHTMGHFIRSPQQIGAVVPSSRFLARRMMDTLDLRRTQTIVELGAGTGAITTELLNRTPPGSKVMIIDANPAAVSILKQRLAGRENLLIVEGDARELQTILKQHNLGRVDAVVSSLPYASLGESITRSILAAAAESLAPDGHFVAFQYTPLLRSTLETYFEIQSSSVELRNFPPAVVYGCVSRKTAHSPTSLKESA
ncbi:MAG: methyltransferase domain-containing protein [Betaproteobacteria bacterium]|nr:methyltransferase domain-containing protein [Betaproteobacteria bacterium]